MNGIKKYDIKNNPIRINYAESVEAFVKRNAAECEKNRNVFLYKDEKTKRKAFLKMLGRPLSPKKEAKAELIDKEIVYSDERVIAERYSFDIGGIIFSGWLLKSNHKPGRRGKKALIFALHGGWGSPELATGIYIDSANYNRFATRLVTEDTMVFVPQLLLWNKETYATDYDRENLNRRLVQQGGSITALELFLLMRCADYFSALKDADKNKLGVAGLSYGGMYALYLGAADKRFKAVYSSCWFNDRAKYDWHDYVYFNAENEFFDTEVASLVLPRKLFIDVGDSDPLFRLEYGEKERARLKEYARKTGNEKNLRLRTFCGEHEFDKDDGTIKEFLAEIL